MSLKEHVTITPQDFHNRYAEAMLNQGRDPNRYKPDLLNNFEATALLTEKERSGIMKVVRLERLLNRDKIAAMAQGIVLYDTSLEAGLGTTFHRREHLRQFGHIDGRGEDPKLGSKSTDTFFPFDGPAGPTAACVRAIRLQRSMESARYYAQVIEQPIVSDDSMDPILGVYNLPTVRSRMGYEADQSFADAIAAIPNFSTAQPILQPALPTIRKSDRRIDYEKRLPGGHGHAAAIVIDRIGQEEASYQVKVTQVSNGDGLNFMTPDIVAAAVYGGRHLVTSETGQDVEEVFSAAAFTFLMTDACECDIKGGKAGLKQLPDGTRVPYLLEVGQVNQEQKDLFYQMGQQGAILPKEIAARHQPGEQIFNTNTILMVHEPIRKFLQSVKTQLGMDYYHYLLTPEFFEDQSGEAIKIDGAMGSLILRMNEMIETNPQLAEIWDQVSEGRDFVRIVNVPREMREEYFGPIKVGADVGEKILNHHQWDPDELRFKNLRPGHTIHWAGDFGRKGAKLTDVTAFEQALGNADVLYLDEIDVQGYCLFADAIHGGTERIICKYVPTYDGDIFDLNSPAARAQLGQLEGRLNLANMEIIIDENGIITFNKISP